jgi:uncharacterized protein (TIGR02246 family)
MIDHRARALEVNDATYVAWNAHDPDAVAAVFAEDAVVRDAGSSDVEIGRDAVRERAARLFAAFPDLTLERIDLVITTTAWSRRTTTSSTWPACSPSWGPSPDTGRAH